MLLPKFSEAPIQTQVLTVFGDFSQIGFWRGFVSTCIWRFAVKKEEEKSSSYKRNPYKLF